MPPPPLVFRYPQIDCKERHRFLEKKLTQQAKIIHSRQLRQSRQFTPLPM